MRVLIAFSICFAALSSFASTGFASTGNNGLLPTGTLSRQVQELREPAKNAAGITRKRREALVVRDRISDFIVQQLETMPSITAGQLQTQLRSFICVDPDSKCEDCHRSPYVYAADWGPKTVRRQVVVAYQLDLGFNGPKSTIVTIDNYIWEQGKARHTSRGGSALNGRQIEFQEVAWYPERNEYWILASGPTMGWSGRAFPGRAIIFQVGIDKIDPVWNTKTLPNLTAEKNELGWEATYADKERFYNNLPKPYVFDVYSLDYLHRTFRRVIHYRY
jgi:hypothetical protein